MIKNKRILTLRDIVEIVADGYRIETLRFPTNELLTGDEGVIFWGLQIDNDFKKEILINQEIGRNQKREAILHEFYHALYGKEGWHQSEKIINSLAKTHFKKLYEK